MNVYKPLMIFNITPITIMTDAAPTSQVLIEAANLSQGRRSLADAGDGAGTGDRLRQGVESLTMPWTTTTPKEAALKLAYVTEASSTASSAMPGKAVRRHG
jgi:hypothetical protein